MGRIDIHNISRQLEIMQDFVRNLGVSKKTPGQVPISRRNSQLILEYDRARGFEGLKDSTRRFLLYKLLTVARVLNVDFDKATKDQIKNTIEICNKKYSAWCASKIRTTFKHFYRWMRYGDNYQYTDDCPDEVKWIKKNLRKKDINQVSPAEIWTEEEIKKLLSKISNPRDKALLSLITETGARVGEIGALHIGDVYQDEFGFLIHLDGKTGQREDRVIYSGPCLAAWLNIHPDRDNPLAPLFPKNKSNEPLAYMGIWSIVKKSVRNAGFENKKNNPHFFRHSRATILADQGWNTQLISAYLGWTADSKMPGNYIHVSVKNANRFLLKAHGITPEDETKPKLNVQFCATCGEQNGPEAKFCKKCGRPLTHEAILKYNQEKHNASEILQEALKDPKVLSELRAFIERKHSQEHV